MRIVCREKLQGYRSSRFLRDQIEPADGPEDQCEAVVARYATLLQMVAPESVDPGSIVIVNGEPEYSVLGRAIEAQGRSCRDPNVSC